MDGVARQAINYGYSPTFICEVFGSHLQTLETDPQAVEKFFSELAQLQDNCVLQERNTKRSKANPFPTVNLFSRDGTPIPRFAAYIAHSMPHADREAFQRLYGANYSVEKLRPLVAMNGLPIDESQINIPDCDVPALLKRKEFVPGSLEAKQLFQAACQASGLGVAEEWWNNDKLHTLLRKESAGKVGCLNYTMRGKNSISEEDFRNRAINSTRKNPTQYASTASGLGQMILTNVDTYYPNGRRGIGDPLQEAVGLIRYIYDRYGDPTTACDMHGKTGTYTNSRTGRRINKTFREGY